MILQKYKNIALIFIIATFSVFNLGIPITLHYCKMMHSYSSELCSMCRNTEMSRTKEVSLATEKCCDTTFLENNNNAFIQYQTKEVTKFQLITLLTNYNIEKIVDKYFSHIVTNLKFINPVNKIELPILNLSLLI